MYEKNIDFIFFNHRISVFWWNKDKFYTLIGFWAGATTEMGLSYRYKPADWSVQFAFLPYYFKDDIFLSFGTSFQKYISETEWTAWFLYIGLSSIYSSYGEGYEGYYEGRGTTGSVNLGIGPGFEVKVLDRFVLSICLGYALYYQYQPSIEPMVNFTAEGRFYYRF